MSTSTLAHGLLVAVRPLYLGGGVLLFGLGAAVGEGHVQPLALALGTVVVVLVHTITHWVNDAEDVATDDVTEATAFTGGSRAIQRGLVTPRQLLVASAVLALGVVVIAAVAAIAGDLPSAAWWIAMLVGGYAYSGRPFTLGRRGLGELDTALVMGVVVPLAGAHAGGGVGPAALSVAGVLFVETVLARLCTAYPDLEADRATGKRTLPVLLGVRGSAAAFVAMAVLCLVVGLVLAPSLPWPDAQRARAVVVALAALAGAWAISSGRADRVRETMPLLGVAAYGVTQALLLAAALLTG
jgi:1,4-dihydroxy-2-naphthoate octaprenyltransferase